MPQDKSTIPCPPALVRAANRFADLTGLTTYLKRRLQKSLADKEMCAKQQNSVDSNVFECMSILANSLHIEPLTALGTVAISTLFDTAYENAKLLHTSRPTPCMADRSDKSAPIFIVGFPRTGTTFLQNLLDLDPRRQAPKMWELHTPALDSSDQAFTKSKTEVERFISANYLLSPRLADVHPMNAEGNEECLKLMENSFFSPTFLLYNSADKYEQWLLSNLESTYSEHAYQAHKKQLELLELNHQRTGGWALKSPAHGMFLNSLRSVYPDSILINTMRDPSISIPSFCSLVETIRLMFYKNVDLVEIGKLGMRFFEACNKEYEKVVRKDHERTLEVHFNTLTTNPLQVMQGVYDCISEELPPEVEKEVTRWATTDAKSLRSKHKFTLERYSLCKDDIESQFSDYLSRCKRLEESGGVLLSATH